MAERYQIVDIPAAEALGSAIPRNMKDGLMLVDTRNGARLVWARLAVGECGRWWWLDRREFTMRSFADLMDYPDDTPNDFVNRMDESDNSIEAVTMLHQFCDALNNAHRAEVLREVEHEHG